MDAVFVAAVFRFLTTTDASGTVAPDASDMVPSTVAVVPCATSYAGAKHNVDITKQKTALSLTIRDRLFIQLPFDLIRLTSSPVKIVATQIQPIKRDSGRYWGLHYCWNLKEVNWPIQYVEPSGGSTSIAPPGSEAVRLLQRYVSASANAPDYRELFAN